MDGDIPDVFLSPELIKVLKKYIFIIFLKECKKGNMNPNINFYKSDVWSLGMIFLSAACLDKLEKCYDYTEMEIFYDEINSKMNLMYSKYGENIQKIISDMLTNNPEERIDFIELSNELKYWVWII